MPHKNTSWTHPKCERCKETGTDCTKDKPYISSGGLYIFDNCEECKGVTACSFVHTIFGLRDAVLIPVHGAPTPLEHAAVEAMLATVQPALQSHANSIYNETLRPEEAARLASEGTIRGIVALQPSAADHSLHSPASATQRTEPPTSETSSPTRTSGSSASHPLGSSRSQVSQDDSASSASQRSRRAKSLRGPITALIMSLRRILGSKKAAPSPADTPRTSTEAAASAAPGARPRGPAESEPRPPPNAAGTSPFKLATLDTHVARATAKATEHREQLEWIRAERRAVRTAIVQRKAELQAAEAQLADSTAKLQALQAQVMADEQELAEKRAALEQLDGEGRIGTLDHQEVEVTLALLRCEAFVTRVERQKEWAGRLEEEARELGEEAEELLTAHGTVV